MKNTIVVLILFSLMALGCATTGEDRISVLERHMVEAENKIASIEGGEGGQGLRDRVAQLRVMTENLSNEVQALNGRLDEMTVKIEQNTDQSKKDDLAENVKLNNERLARIEKHLKLAPLVVEKGSGAQIAPGSPEAAPKELTEEELYTLAKQEFDIENYDSSREKFEQFIKRFPKSDNADNSQFWVGEIYYRQKWYEKAILEYQKVIENYPKGNKVESALFKQGLSFSNLGDKANAKLIFNELINKYPNSPEADAAKAKLKEL
jgi:tol-pal system protein YbgF